MTRVCIIAALLFAVSFDLAGAKDVVGARKAPKHASPAAIAPETKAPATKAPNEKAPNDKDTADRTGSLAPRTVDEEALPPEFNLPSASRARMRQCGEKWQSMKMAGTAGDDIWRDFAAKCLAASD